MNSQFAYVYSFENEDTVKILFHWENKKFEFNRKKNETIRQTLERISLKLQPKKKKGKKKGEKEEEKITFNLKILKENEDIPDTFSNKEGFSDRHLMKINKEVYKIIVNPPTVSSLILSDSILSGFPSSPDIQIEFGDIKNSKFSWYKSSSCTSTDWQLVHNQFIYTPTNDDISFYLKCICIPGNQHFSMESLKTEAISTVQVSANPGICLFDNRHLYTPNYLVNGTEFRIVTYNVLADLFVDSDFARTVLYPYCPSYALNYKYRIQLLLKEILGYHADIIALQECEKKIFNKYLEPVLKLYGYFGILNIKLGEMPEGEALFILEKSFEHIIDHTISVRDAFEHDCNKGLLNRLKKCPLLCEKILKKTTIGQIHILKYVKEESSSRYICLLNTHLYYKPYAAQIRLIQIAALMNYINEIVKEFKENLTFIALGDFNTLKGEPLLDYLQGDEINNQHDIWKLTEDFDPNGEIKRLNINLKTPIVVKNITRFPPFTNFVQHFQNTLDYIFTEDNNKLEMIAFVPLPEEDEIRNYVALPSVVAPSDHLPLIVDFKWK